MRRVWTPALCALIQLVSFSAGQGSIPGGWLSGLMNLLGLLAVVALAWREQAPRVVLGITVIGYLVQVLAVGPIVPAAVAVAVYVVARNVGSRDPFDWWSAAAVVGAAVAVVGGSIIGGAAFLSAPSAGLVLGAALAGVLRASRAAREAASRQELVVAERLRIARDLHDVVGHGVGGIVVQAGAGRVALAAGDVAAARESLSTIESAGRGVLTEVRWMVTLLREASGRPGLSDIPDLVSGARRCGIDVEFVVDGELATAPDEIGEAGYRIVQEALTNVLRHARNQTATVRVSIHGDLSVSVVDHGVPPSQLPVEGNGIRGMRERANAVGGDARIGPAADGWSVTARLPVSRRPR